MTDPIGKMVVAWHKHQLVLPCLVDGVVYKQWLFMLQAFPKSIRLSSRAFQGQTF